MPSRRWSTVVLGVVLLGSTAAQASSRVGDYTLQLLSETGQVLPTFQENGRSYVMGTRGHRYTLRVRNRSERRIEVVASVDGRDVVDGQPASMQKRGYLLDPHGEVIVEGFRMSTEAVAAFTFSSVGASYAARTGGDTRDVGVIGVAVFVERQGEPMVQASPPRSPPIGEGRGPEDEAASAAPSTPAAAPMPSRAKKAELKPAASMAPAPAGLTGLGATGAAAGGGGLGSPASPRRLSASAPPTKTAPVERPGLGTEYGVAEQSHAEEVAFERASARPAAVLSLHYDNREGLEALGIDVEGRLEASREARRRQSAQPFRRDQPTFERTPSTIAR